MAAISRIELEGRTSTVLCAYLTDGTGGKTPASTRNEESLDVLARVGVKRSNVFFPGSEIPIADGHLVHHLDLALDHLDRQMTGVEVETIYCLAWEGGHHDHDAAQLVAAAFAKRRDRLDSCIEVPLYRHLAGPFFRVLSPLRDHQPWSRRRITLRDGLRYCALPWRYRSQRRSWLGLLPGTFLKLAVLRREDSRRVDITRYSTRPHPGRLFYEGRFRFPYERFERAAAPFLTAHFR